MPRTLKKLQVPSASTATSWPMTPPLRQPKSLEQSATDRPGISVLGYTYSKNLQTNLAGTLASEISLLKKVNPPIRFTQLLETTGIVTQLSGAVILSLQTVKVGCYREPSVTKAIKKIMDLLQLEGLEHLQLQLQERLRQR